MAVNVEQLAVAIRAGSSAEELAILTRLLAVAQATVSRHAPEAPEAVQDEAAIRIAGYLFDAPNAGRGIAYGHALRNSGAASLLLPWRVHRAGSIGEAVEAAAASGSVGNPVINVTLAGSTLTVSYADGSAAALQLPAGGGDGDGEGGPAVDQAARDAAAAALAAIAPFALAEDPSGFIPAERVAENPVEDSVPVVVAGGRSFRYIERAVLASVAAATEATRGTVRGATTGQASASSGTTILGWTVNRLRAVITAALATVTASVAEAGTSTARRVWTALRVRQAIQAVVPTWGRAGDAGTIPVAKVNLVSVQNQIDHIVDELAHQTGPVTGVVGQLGSGSDSLRYDLGNIEGEFDISVRVKVRVQVNQFQNFSGSLSITVAPGIGFAGLFPDSVTHYGQAHEAVLHFVRQGIELPAGANHILDFRTGVSGQGAPAVHFVEVENLTYTPTSILNQAAVGAFVHDWAEAPNEDPIPDGKLSGVQPWALVDAADDEVPTAEDMGTFDAADLAAIPAGGQRSFALDALVQRDPDGTLAIITRGWEPQADAGAAGDPAYTLIGEGVTLTDNENAVFFSPETAVAFVAAWNGAVYPRFMFETTWANTMGDDVLSLFFPRRPDALVDNRQTRIHLTHSNAATGDPQGESREFYLESRRTTDPIQLFVNALAGMPFRDGMTLRLYGVSG